MQMQHPAALKPPPCWPYKSRVAPKLTAAFKTVPLHSSGEGAFKQMLEISLSTNRKKAEQIKCIFT